MLRIVLALLIALSLAGASCSERPPPQMTNAAADMDQLFQRLQNAAGPHEAQMIEAAILAGWSSSGDAQVDELMLAGIEAVNGADVDAALAAFDQVVRRAPRFAEGWNMRATVHWLNDDYAPAVTDLWHVLVLEPRHYVALNLLGRIFVETGDPQTAVQVFEEALKINPYLEDALRQIEELSDEVAGVPI